MQNDNFLDRDEYIESLLNKLDIFKPSVKEMLQEISQAGLSIRLENADMKFIEKHKNEVITSMWKVVRVSKMVDEKNFNINLTLYPSPSDSQNNVLN